MAEDSRRTARFPMLVLLVLGLGVPAGLALAQDFDDEDEEEPEAAQQMGFIEMNEQQISSWMFGNVNDVKQAREKIEAQLKLQIDDIARICELDDSQREKLMLAGAGDMKRFFDRVEEKRAKHLNKRYDQNQFNDVYQEFQAIRTAYNSNLFGERSLYGKTIKRALGDSQYALYETVVEDRKAFRYKAKVELAVALLARSLGLRSGQRRELSALIFESTRAPNKFGQQQDNYYIMYQLGRVPEDKLRPIFDDAQWKVLRQQMQNAKGMEQWLRQNGYDLDDEPEPAEPAS